MKRKIMCPICARRGYTSWLASEDNIHGYGYLYLWCKRCKQEIKIDIKDIKTQRGGAEG